MYTTVLVIFSIVWLGPVSWDIWYIFLIFRNFRGLFWVLFLVFENLKIVFWIRIPTLGGICFIKLFDLRPPYMFFLVFWNLRGLFLFEIWFLKNLNSTLNKSSLLWVFVNFHFKNIYFLSYLHTTLSCFNLIIKCFNTIL